MTTLAKDTPRTMEIGDRNEFPVIASDIIYEGAAVGLVAASGHARPLTSADRFVGFAEKQADNSAGAAAAINVRVIKKGSASLSVSGAVITDVGQPIYATDDNTFVFTPVSSVFIGFVRRFVSSGVVIVEFDAGVLEDPNAGWTWETTAVDKTLDVQDSGKGFVMTADAKTFTLPATAVSIRVKLMNLGAFGTQLMSIAPVAADKIMGPDLPGTDNTALLNTKATARRGDYAVVRLGHADGPFVDELVGTWASA